ncbi:MAG TPA: hypothetical protein VJT84_01955 [Gaiellaceae bacterium]|nr:hypothetical protein [Gaiellaceae bacterium]
MLNGKATWRWKVEDTTAAGRATAAAVCGQARASTKIVIVGSLIPARLEVVKDGFSTRSKSNGTDLSYGVVLPTPRRTPTR